MSSNKYLENKSKRVSKNQRLRRIWSAMLYRCYNPKKVGLTGGGLGKKY